jgi:NAD(P)H-dependent FMN reductase
MYDALFTVILFHPRPVCMIHATGATAKPRLLVILGSTRKGRICPQVAAWVVEIGQAAIEASFEIVDLRDWPLPMDDEPGVPAAGKYVKEHTLAWSRKVSEGDAVVFVTPQYNWGYPAPLKNALDHLYEEWRDKPAVIVTYGGHGGGKCAQQLRQVALGLNMNSMETMPGLKLARSLIEANDGNVTPERDFADGLPQVRQAFAELAAHLSNRRAGSTA